MSLGNIYLPKEVRKEIYNMKKVAKPESYPNKIVCSLVLTITLLCAVVIYLYC